MGDYEQFLKRKEVQSIAAGFSVNKEDLNKSLFPFQRDIVAWALEKGKASVFTDCGTGKTAIMLEFAHQVCARTGCTALIVAPLSVAEQTRREGGKMSSTDITQEDITLWKKAIIKAQKALDANSEDAIKESLSNIASDMCFLVTFTESLLKIEVDQSVYDKARELQKRNYHPLAGSWEREE